MYKFPNNNSFALLTAIFTSCFQTSSQAQFYESSLLLEKIQYGLNICQADFNKDGKLDYISGGYAGEKLKIYFQQNTDGVYVGKPYEIDEVMEFQGLATADFNTDGALDIIVGGSPLLCLFGDGHDDFIKQEKLSDDYCISLVIADFDGNGGEDFAAINDQKISFFWNDGTGKFEETSVAIKSPLSDLKKADMNKDGKMDLVFSCNEKGSEYIGYLANKGSRNFDKKTLVKTEAHKFQVADYNNDTWLDIVTINTTNKTLCLWQGDEKINFENKQNIFVGGYFTSPFVLDINADKKMDFVLVDYDGSISFVLNKGSQNFVKTPTVAKIPNYLRMVDLLPTTDNNSLQFIHTGSEMHGMHKVFLPKMSSNLQKPFDIIASKQALKKIQTELSQYYNMEKVNTDALVLGYKSIIKDITYQDIYLIAVEGDWFKFDTEGTLLSGTPTVSTTRYSAYPNETVFVAYDLEQELKKNGSAYSCNIVNEFLTAFYPNVKFDLFSSDVYYFAFKGTRQTKEELHELSLSWQSYSDGLEWNFWTTDLFRTIHKDQYEIISSDAASAEIKSYLNARYAKKFCDAADVFRRTTRNFSTEQKTKNVPFQPDQTMSDTSYGVYIKGHLLLFDMDGNYLGKE